MSEYSNERALGPFLKINHQVNREWFSTWNMWSANKTDLTTALGNLDTLNLHEAAIKRG